MFRWRVIIFQAQYIKKGAAQYSRCIMAGEQIQK